MKKTILIAIIVMILAVSTVLLTACGTKMFPVNEERANKQVTATVNYKDRVSIVSVEELYNQFYSYYSYLYTYYQNGYISAEQMQSYLGKLDETFENSNKSLAKSALYNLVCIDTMYNYYVDTMPEGADGEVRRAGMVAASTKGKTYDFGKMADLAQYYADRNVEMETILACYKDYSYLNNAVRSANKDLQDRYDSYLETVRAEYAALEGSAKDTTPEGFTGISVKETPYRLIYEVDSDATLDTTGLVVVANYAEKTDEHDLTVEIPTKYLVFSGFSASSAADDQVITITYAGKTATFTVDIVTARPKREQPAKEDDDDAKDNSKPEAKFAFEIDEADYIKAGMTEAELVEARQELKFARSAMSRLNNYLKENYRTYDNYLYGYLVTEMRSLTEATKANDVYLTAAELDAEYNRLIDERKANLAVSDFAKSDAESLKTALLQPKQIDADTNEETYGYYYVAQVLFKFTDEQSNAISQHKTAGNSNETDIQRFTINQAQKIGVWVSNPDYDADATCELESCTCPHCKNYVLPGGAQRPSYETLDDWYRCADDCECVACPSKKYILSTDTEDGSVNVMDVIKSANPVVGFDSIEVALDKINADATITADAKAYRQALLDAINDWSYKANEDSGVFTYITNKKYGYIMTPEGESSGMVKAFETAADLLAEYAGKDFDFSAERRAELEAQGVFIESAQGGVGSYAWCVTEYGVHFIVLTAYTVDDDFGTVTATTVGEDAYYQLGLDYVYNSIEYDASTDNSLAVKQADGTTRYYPVGTVGYTIGSELLSEKVTANYSKFQKDTIIGNEDEAITYNPKGYEYMLKQLQKNTAE